jgi:hypothetical protein
MTAIQNGTSTLTVRIASANVTGSGVNGTSGYNQTGDPANTTTAYNVVNKPYYDKTVISKAGVPIRGSEYVLLSTVQKAADMVDVILSAAPSSLTSRMAGSNQFMIFGPGEHSYNIPEHRDIFLRDAWNRAEGYGGSVAATSAANVERHHNIPAAQRPYASGYASGYRNESILAHEFGHGILNPGMNSNNVVNPGAPANTSMRTEHIAIYNSSRATPENPNNPDGRKKWDGASVGSSTYMSANNDEFMATAVAIWFNAMASSNSWTNNYGALNTREQLRVYDTPFYNFLSRVLPETKALSDAWSTGVPSTGNPYIHPAPAEPAGKYGPSVKIKSTLAANPAGSGLQMYIPFNAAANTITNVELWWDVDTDLMRWYLEPDADESYFRIRKKIERSHTLNAQDGSMALMPAGSAATDGTRVVLAAVSSANDAQWWNIRRQADGTFIIINKMNSQMALALESDATASGTRIALASATSSNSRFWNITDGDVPLEQRITAAAALDNIKVSAGTPLSEIELPGTVSVSINSIRNNANNTPVYGTMSKNIPVTWNTTAYNSNVPGTYTMEGTLLLDGLVTNPGSHNASVTVIVESSNSVLSAGRFVPGSQPDNEALSIVPLTIFAGEFTVGPNPVEKQSGTVNIFWQGKRIQNAALTVFDASGHIVNKKVLIKDDYGTQARRPVGLWDLTDTKGRLVAGGTYLLKGAVTVDGRKEKVSVIIGVR